MGPARTTTAAPARAAAGSRTTGARAEWTALRPRGRAVADLSALAALGCVVAGGIAAAALAMVGPMLMYEHARVGADRDMVELAFAVLTEVVFRAVWQFLDAYLLAIWWFGVGVLLLADQPRVARLSLTLVADTTAGLTLSSLSIGCTCVRRSRCR